MKKNKVIAIMIASGFFTAFALGSGNSGSYSSVNNSAATKIGEVATENEEKNNPSTLIGSSTSSDNSSHSSSDLIGGNVNNNSEIYVGDSCKNGNLKITYVKSGEFKEYNQFNQPKDGNKYVYIEIYVENTGETDASISALDFDGFADGYAVDQNYLEDLFSATLSAGRNTTGKIILEVPNDAEEIEFEYNMNFFTSERLKFIYEGEKDSGFVPDKNTDVSKDAFHVGDILETSKLRITYLSCGELKSDNMFMQPKDGFKYLYIELDFENISNSDQFVSSFDFDCFADGSACSQSLYTGDDKLDATISAGRKTKGKVVFEVPNDATTVEFEYLDNMWTSGRILFLYE